MKGLLSSIRKGVSLQRTPEIVVTRVDGRRERHVRRSSVEGPAAAAAVTQGKQEGQEGQEDVVEVVEEMDRAELCASCGQLRHLCGCVDSEWDGESLFALEQQSGKQDRGRYAVATQQIPPGTTLFRERAFIWVARAHAAHRYCFQCLRYEASGSAGEGGHTRHRKNTTTGEDDPLIVWCSAECEAADAAFVQRLGPCLDILTEVADKHEVDRDLLLAVLRYIDKSMFASKDAPTSSGFSNPSSPVGSPAAAIGSSPSPQRKHVGAGSIGSAGSAGSPMSSGTPGTGAGSVSSMRADAAADAAAAVAAAPTRPPGSRLHGMAPKVFFQARNADVRNLVSHLESFSSDWSMSVLAAMNDLIVCFNPHLFMLLKIIMGKRRSRAGPVSDLAASVAEAATRVSVALQAQQSAEGGNKDQHPLDPHEQRAPGSPLQVKSWLLRRALEFACTVNSNAHAIAGTIESGGELEYNSKDRFGLFPLLAMLNHSCAPNCCYSADGDVIVVRSVRAIEPGEELCVQYIGPYQPRSFRQRLLLHDRFFSCGCERCKEYAAERELTGLLCKMTTCNGYHYMHPRQGDAASQLRGLVKAPTSTFGTPRIVLMKRSSSSVVASGNDTDASATSTDAATDAAPRERDGDGNADDAALLGPATASTDDRPSFLSARRMRAVSAPESFQPPAPEETVLEMLEEGDMTAIAGAEEGTAATTNTDNNVGTYGGPAKCGAATDDALGTTNLKGGRTMAGSGPGGTGGATPQSPALQYDPTMGIPRLGKPKRRWRISAGAPSSEGGRSNSVTDEANSSQRFVPARSPSVPRRHRGQLPVEQHLSPTARAAATAAAVAVASENPAETRLTDAEAREPTLPSPTPPPPPTQSVATSPPPPPSCAPGPPTAPLLSSSSATSPSSSERPRAQNSLPETVFTNNSPSALSTVMPTAPQRTSSAQPPEVGNRTADGSNHSFSTSPRRNPHSRLASWTGMLSGADLEDVIRDARISASGGGSAADGVEDNIASDGDASDTDRINRKQTQEEQAADGQQQQKHQRDGGAEARAEAEGADDAASPPALVSEHTKIPLAKRTHVAELQDKSESPTSPPSPTQKNRFAARTMLDRTLFTWMIDTPEAVTACEKCSISLLKSHPGVGAAMQLEQMLPALEREFSEAGSPRPSRPIPRASTAQPATPSPTQPTTSPTIRSTVTQSPQSTEAAAAAAAAAGAAAAAAATLAAASTTKADASAEPVSASEHVAATNAATATAVDASANSFADADATGADPRQIRFADEGNAEDGEPASRKRGGVRFADEAADSAVAPQSDGANPNKGVRFADEPPAQAAKATAAATTDSSGDSTRTGGIRFADEGAPAAAPAPRRGVRFADEPAGDNDESGTVDTIPEPSKSGKGGGRFADASEPDSGGNSTEHVKKPRKGGVRFADESSEAGTTGADTARSPRRGVRFADDDLPSSEPKPGATTEPEQRSPSRGVRFADQADDKPQSSTPSQGVRFAGDDTDDDATTKATAEETSGQKKRKKKTVGFAVSFGEVGDADTDSDKAGGGASAGGGGGARVGGGGGLCQVIEYEQDEEEEVVLLENLVSDASRFLHPHHFLLYRANRLLFERLHRSMPDPYVVDDQWREAREAAEDGAVSYPQSVTGASLSPAWVKQMPATASHPYCLAGVECLVYGVAVAMSLTSSIMPGCSIEAATHMALLTDLFLKVGRKAAALMREEIETEGIAARDAAMRQSEGDLRIRSHSDGVLPERWSMTSLTTSDTLLTPRDSLSARRRSSRRSTWRWSEFSKLSLRAIEAVLWDALRAPDKAFFAFASQCQAEAVHHLQVCLGKNHPLTRMNQEKLARAQSRATNQERLSLALQDTQFFGALQEDDTMFSDDSEAPDGENSLTMPTHRSSASFPPVRAGTGASNNRRGSRGLNSAATAAAAASSAGDGQPAAAGDAELAGSGGNRKRGGRGKQHDRGHSLLPSWGSRTSGQVKASQTGRNGRSRSVTAALTFRRGGKGNANNSSSGAGSTGSPDTPGTPNSDTRTGASDSRHRSSS